MQLEMPLTPALSPWDGEREKPICALAHSPDSALWQNAQKASLSPSDGERARVRGCSVPYFQRWRTVLPHIGSNHAVGNAPNPGPLAVGRREGEANLRSRPLTR